MPDSNIVGGSHIIEIVKAEPVKPGEAPRFGDRRVVKLVPTPWNIYGHCIWRAGQACVEDGQTGHWCVVLVEKGGPQNSRTDDGNIRPASMTMFLPDVLWDKLPTDVVEW